MRGRAPAASATRHWPCWRHTTHVGRDVGVGRQCRPSARRAAGRANAAGAPRFDFAGGAMQFVRQARRRRCAAGVPAGRRPCVLASSRPGVSSGSSRQLQLQAFAERTRADAGRIEALHLVQHGQDLVVAGVDLRHAGSRRWPRSFRAGNRRRRSLRSAPRRSCDRAATGGSGATATAGGPAAFRLRRPVRRAASRRRCRPGRCVRTRFRRRPRRRLRRGGCVVVLRRRCRSRVGRLGRRAAVRRGFFPVQQRVAFHRAGDLQLEFRRRQLQQADGLPQLRRHDQMLSQRCLEAGLHVGSNGAGGNRRPDAARTYRRKVSPRYTRRTSGFASSASGAPCASTLPSLRM